MRTGRSSSTATARSMICGQVVRAVGEVDGEATDDERRPDDDRVADALGDDEGFFDGRRHAAFRLRDPEPVDESGEAHALLGLVDRLEVEAAQGDAGGGERPAPVPAASGRRTGRTRRARAVERSRRARTSSTLSASSDSKYRRDEASKSVDTVSGLELTMIALRPMRRSASAAWTAQ